MMFADRRQAGQLLASLLAQRAFEDPVILALPRGGLPVARPIADRLGAPLDILVARKLGAPGQPELAIGAVTPRNIRRLNDDLLRYLTLPPGYLASETDRQREVAAQREAYLRGSRRPVDVAGKTAIVVDDGIATGMTMLAAVTDLRTRDPAKVVVAAPVASPDAYEALLAEAEEVIVLDVPRDFMAVGQFYRRFEPVEDTEARAEFSAARAR